MRVPVIALLLLIAASSNARADCAAGPDYQILVGDPAPSTVKLEVQRGSPDEGCGRSVPMLRQNIDTGEVVQLAFCIQTTYLDECVPAGRYRYGLATPLPCEGCGGTPFFAIAEVPDDPAACTPSAGDSGPTPYTGTIPWTSTTGPNATEAVDFVCTGGPGCSAGGRLHVRALDSLALLGAIGWSMRRRRRRSR
jgi:hypothetical protein